MLERVTRSITWWLGTRPRDVPAAAELVVAGAPDEVLLRSVPVLRGLRAKITRYDVEDGALEARMTRRRVEAIVRLRVAAVGPGDRTRLTVEGDAAIRRTLMSRLSAALA